MVAYSPLVKYVAGRMASGLPAHVEEADLISYGLIGLINAIERFDLEREIKFETYAITRIKGAIIDELRSLDWVPRSVRARAREIERVHGKLEHRLHRTPTDEEMARELEHLASRSSRRRWSRSPTRRSSRSTSCGRSRTPPATRSRCWTRCTTRTRRTRSRSSTPPSSRTAWPTRSRALPEREKLVIALYYYENLTLREIGEVLGVTESRISQLHTKAVLRLKSRLQGDNRSRVRVCSARHLPSSPSRERGRHEESEVPGHVPCAADRIRNVALVGHRGSGKTSLHEALLFEAGATTRLGSVADGTTVSDADEDEKARGMSISASLASFEWRDVKVNLIDTPGEPSFIADALGALRVCESAVFVVNARDGRRGRHAAPVGARQASSASRGWSS